MKPGIGRLLLIALSLIGASGLARAELRVDFFMTLRLDAESPARLLDPYDVLKLYPESASDAARLRIREELSPQAIEDALIRISRQVNQALSENPDPEQAKRIQTYFRIAQKARSQLIHSRGDVNRALERQAQSPPVLEAKPYVAPPKPEPVIVDTEFSIVPPDSPAPALPPPDHRHHHPDHSVSNPHAANPALRRQAHSAYHRALECQKQQMQRRLLSQP